MILKTSLHITRTMVWFIVVGYSIFLVGKSTYDNYQFNRDIATEQAQIAQLEKEQEAIKLSLIYYRSNSFKEVEARRRLGLKGKDEFVVALPAAASEPAFAIPSLLEKQSTPSQLTPYQSWWNLFFGGAS